MERLRTFRLAGHPLRQGVEDDTTAVPALIPIPEGLGKVSLVACSILTENNRPTLRQFSCCVVRSRLTVTFFFASLGAFVYIYICVCQYTQPATLL